MSKVDLGKLLEDSGAILKGHFVLTSGRHSDVYFEKFRVLERPDVLSELCGAIAAHFQETGTKVPGDAGTKAAPSSPSGGPTSNSAHQASPFDLVAGPTTGGIIIAFEVARRLGLPALYVESEDGVRKLRRGATVPPGARVLVVDDVLTTGKSVLETAEVIRAQGGLVNGVAVLIDRSETPIDFGCPAFASFRVSALSYAPDEVPDWLAAIPVQKPGTSKQATN